LPLAALLSSSSFLELFFIAPEYDGEMEKINEYIYEFSLMERGVFIKNPTEEIWLDDGIKMSRMGLKHIVESRMEDNYSVAQIVVMIYRIPEVINAPEIDIENPNQKYWGSRIAGKLYPDEERGLMIIYQQDSNNIKYVYNAYYRPQKRFLKMK
jgi:hypothetical protein